MLKAFEDVQKQIGRQVWKPFSIDNVIFRLHYRLTFWALLTATILVSSRQYIGEHIRCISDTVPNNVINTFCFFTTTFTIPRFNNDTQVPHPGVGPMGRAELASESVVHHAYYQWVPFVLFGQAIMFYLPHLVWRVVEGGTIKVLVEGLQFGYLAIADRDVGKAPSKSKYMAKVNVVRTTFMNRLKLNQWWGHWLIGCEVLNALNLILQVLMTDAFLGGKFLGLGPAVVNQQPADTECLDLVFPKVTKCAFMKYGASGTIQTHDALCIMALNIINEKIYTFLWFWFAILAVLTAGGLLWRVLTLLLHHRSPRFNQLLFDYDNRLNPEDFEIVISRCEFSHWLFLLYLCKNMHQSAKNMLFRDLAQEMRDLKSNGYHNRNTLPLSLSSDYPKKSPSPASELRPRGVPVSLDEPDESLMSQPSQPLLPAAAPGDVDPQGRPHSD
ncbi:innexin inx7 [Thrips palmi]|uniref:Innexin n=1 Tax=Thrips palmi TaxID=161013 RepID=A0A6P8YWU1_THRPL|nr:innexin inx7 [Thrips palmi]